MAGGDARVETQGMEAEKRGKRCPLHLRGGEAIATPKTRRLQEDLRRWGLIMEDKGRMTRMAWGDPGKAREGPGRCRDRRWESRSLRTGGENGRHGLRRGMGPGGGAGGWKRPHYRDW